MAESQQMCSSFVNELSSIDFLQKPENQFAKDAYMKNSLSILLEDLRQRALKKVDARRAAIFENVSDLIKSNTLGVIVFGDPRRKLKINKSISLQQMHPTYKSDTSIAFVIHRNLFENLWDSSKHKDVSHTFGKQAELAHKRMVRLKNAGNFSPYINE